MNGPKNVRGWEAAIMSGPIYESRTSGLPASRLTITWNVRQLLNGLVEQLQSENAIEESCLSAVVLCESAEKLQGTCPFEPQEQRVLTVDAVPQLQVLLFHCLWICSECTSLQTCPSNCGPFLQPMLQQLVVSFRTIHPRHSVTCRLLQPDLTVLSLATRIVYIRGEFRPRQTRQLPRAVDLKGRLLSCQSS